jgi:transcriptional regulator with XRE-family HTH domain
MSNMRKIVINWDSVGRRIREYRGLDLKQASFARELGISQGQLSRYEKGISEIGAQVLLRLARISGKSIEWWLTGED